MKMFDLLEQDLSSKKEVTIHKETPIIQKIPEKSLGLSSKEAHERLIKYGKNELKSKKRVSPVHIFLSQYKDIMTIILLVCTAVSIFMGEYVEAIAIAIIVLMNGFLGFIQEYRTEKTLEALKNMASPMSNVYRDSVITQIHTNEIVIGDVVLLEAGDKIPADGRLIESTSLECDESMLTGESLPVKKQHSTNLQNLNVEKKESVYMGCVVTKGHCEFLVSATGMDTQMGNIASMLQTIDEEQTPLQIRLAQLSKYIAIGCLLVCAVVSITGMLRGEEFMQMLITGVSLAVAAVPEGLPAIVTISLALAVSRMVKRNALVRRLHAVETLGCATVICSDKTGTLTQNKMTATDICFPSGRLDAQKLDLSSKATQLLLNGITLCNNAIVYSGKGNDFGGHTEIALLNLSASHGITRNSLEEKFKRVSENPFDSDRKRMSVVVEDEFHQKYLFAKGAFDILLDRCVEYQDGDMIRPMLARDKIRFNEQSGKMADSALRVIGVAYKKITPLSPGSTEDNLIFLGLVGMIDPPRKEVKQAVSRCHKAGIKTIMITGDHKKTATAIASQVGIYHDGDVVVTGAELDAMSLNELSEIVNKVSVFARVSPNHKLQIVKALKRRGHIVAMTGDGVNDAPAIKEADIGVSMGLNGSDVTKEASEIILLDD
ncbi:MAG: HAD-IC family P-type ATPase, partial [Oscillospiraceae bacterium]